MPGTRGRQVDRGAARRRAARLSPRPQGFTDDGFRHIFVVPAAGGTPRQITRGNWDHAGREWTPDGRSILFSGLRSAGRRVRWRESEIYAVDVANGAIRQLTTRKGPDGNPSVSPDGKLRRLHRLRLTTDTWIDSSST